MSTTLGKAQVPVKPRWLPTNPEITLSLGSRGRKSAIKTFWKGYSFEKKPRPDCVSPWCWKDGDLHGIDAPCREPTSSLRTERVCCLGVPLIPALYIYPSQVRMRLELSGKRTPTGLYFALMLEIRWPSWDWCPMQGAYIKVTNGTSLLFQFLWSLPYISGRYIYPKSLASLVLQGSSQVRTRLELSG